MSSPPQPAIHTVDNHCTLYPTFLHCTANVSFFSHGHGHGVTYDRNAIAPLLTLGLGDKQYRP